MAARCAMRCWGGRARMKLTTDSSMGWRGGSGVRAAGAAICIVPGWLSFIGAGEEVALQWRRRILRLIDVPFNHHCGAHRLGSRGFGSLLRILARGFLLFLLPALCGDAVDLVFINGVQDALLGDVELSVHGLANDGVAGIAVDEVCGGQLHGRELGETGIEIGLVDACGMQLLIEPFARGPWRGRHQDRRAAGRR